MGCVELGEGVNTITTTFGCEGVQNREFFVGLRPITFTRPYSITADTNAAAIKNGVIQRIDTNGDTSINVGLYYPSGSEVTWVEPGENVILKGDFDSNAVDGVNIHTTCYINGVLAETYIDKLSTIKENIKIDESNELRSFTVPQCDKIVVYVWDDNLQPLASAKIINNRKPQEGELYVNAEIGSGTIPKQKRDYQCGGR